MSKKKDNFIRLAENRTNKIIDTIRLLGNLSNTSYYEYTDAQVNKVFNAIESELELQRKKFKAQSNSKQRFRL